MNDIVKPKSALRAWRHLVAGVRIRGTALRAWWKRLSMDEKAVYLSNSTSLCDLEDRLRRWNSLEQDARRLSIWHR